MGTVTLTLRVDEALISKLDAEAKRRSLLAGALGAISRNVMASIALTGFLDGAVPSAPTKVKAKPQKGPEKPAKVRGKRKGKAETPSAEERELQKRVRAVPGYTGSLAKELSLAPQTVNFWATNKRNASWPEERLARVREWLNKQEG
jgi:hypothetical protein